MKNTQMNITQYMTRFNNGDFESNDLDTQIEAGWYDWFCRDSSLAEKTRRMTQRLRQIIDSPKFDNETSYVWFKNNCPMFGNLYDDFRIADIETGKTIYCIVPKSGHKMMNGMGEVWGAENDFKEALITAKWPEIKKWFFVDNK